MYILFFFAVEFFILSLLIYNKNKQPFEIITILVELTVIPFFHVGASMISA